jgi:tetratricopeptide (TPR) repeat protein
MRIGIHTGPVVVGRIGDDLRMDYTAVGDTTNLAARLQGLAEPGAVLISEVTRRLVEGWFDLEALPAQEVKGVARPVRAFRVAGARRVGGRVEALETSRGGLTPFVGRIRELESLAVAFASARAGRGQVVFVVGEAGIGKSRLLYEFRRQIGGEPHEWVEGRCASYARSSPFYAIADAMRRLHEIDDRDDEEAALTKLAARGEWFGEALAWTLPYLRGLLSLPTGDPTADALDPMTRRAETCRALQARTLRAAEAAPQVIVVEDLHWIDAASEEFLSFIADTVPAARVLLVLTHRPGYQHPFGDRSFHVRIPLQALSDEDTSAMVGGVLSVDGLPIELRALIAAKAEGNPLFIEEVTTSLLEEGVLALEQGRIRLTRELADIAIPDRIQDVLMARLDRLPDEPKRALQIASVIGREFALRLLQRVDAAGEQFNAVVGELRSLELIYEKSAYPELAYMFKHALTHEVAYESVLVQRRKALHRIVGVAIEELYRDRLPEHYEALAHHFAAAEDWEQALHYHELASQKAAAAYANRAAADHCTAAIAIAHRLGDVDRERRIALWVRLAECEWTTSRFGASGRAFERAAELAESPAERAAHLARGAYSLFWEHQYERAEELARQAATVAEAHGADGAHAIALTTQDAMDVVCGRNIRDLAQIEHARELARRSGEWSVRVFVDSHAAMRAEWRGEFARSMDLSAAAVSVAQQQGDPGKGAFAFWFLGIATVCVGEYGRGIGLLADGVGLCERIGDQAVRARMLNTLGWAHAEIGAVERAMEFNRQATELGREIVELGLVAGAPELYANAAINLASNLIELGRLDEAVEQLAPIQRQLEKDPDPWMRWRWSLHLLHQQARLALARGDLAGAGALAARELAGAEECAARKLVGRAEEMLGRIALLADDRAEARRALEAAFALAREISYPSLACRAQSLRAELARRQGDTALAERRCSELRQSLAALAPRIGAADLEHDFRRLGERLIERPL